MAKSAEDGSGTTETRKPEDIASEDVLTPIPLNVELNLDCEFK